MHDIENTGPREDSVHTGGLPIKRRIIIACVAALAAGVAAALWAWSYATAPYPSDDTRIYIPAGSSQTAIADSLTSRLGDAYGSKVARLWRLRGGKPAKAEGAYVVRKGMRAISAAQKLLRGAQDPVRVTFNNVRTLPQLAERIGARMEFTPEAFLEACDSVLSPEGYAKAEYPSAFLPDTYEFYWNARPAFVVRSLLAYHDRFWTEGRKAKAADLGLTPAEVSTLASIVEEETVKSDERGAVARLYLNRLDKGMMLQADPTVKFAVGDFSLRRIRGEHLAVDSPYNTYMHTGLPPGPIRIPDARTLDAVLDAPAHHYIYMCAKPDFSGYHNFAATGAEHMRNARLYHKALNARGVN